VCSSDLLGRWNFTVCSVTQSDVRCDDHGWFADAAQIAVFSPRDRARACRTTEGAAA